MTSLPILARALVLVGACVAIGTPPAAAPRASAFQVLELQVTASRSVVPADDPAVRYSIAIIVSDVELPVTITAITSDLHGDVADAGNPLLTATACEVPADYAEETPGMGWQCEYQALLESTVGDVANTLTATLRLSDASEVAVTGTATVTVSDRLGAIEGLLVDADTGAPIPDTWVYGAGLGLGPDSEFGGPSDAEGRFSAVGLPPGQYRLRSGAAETGAWVPAPGPEYRTPYAFEYFDETPQGIPVAQSITVEPGETTDIVWELSVGGVIEGRLTDATTGAPVTDTEVWWWIRDEAGAPSPGEAGGSVALSDDGTYRISGLRGGDYMVCFARDSQGECWDDKPLGDHGIFSDGDPITAALGVTTTGIDAVLGVAPAADDGSGDGGGVADPQPALPRTGGRNAPFSIAGLLALLAGGGLLLVEHRTRPS